MQSRSISWDVAFADHISLPQTTEIQAYLKAFVSWTAPKNNPREFFSSAAEALQEELFFF